MVHSHVEAFVVWQPSVRFPAKNISSTTSSSIDPDDPLLLNPAIHFFFGTSEQKTAEQHKTFSLQEHRAHDPPPPERPSQNIIAVVVLDSTKILQNMATLNDTAMIVACKEGDAATVTDLLSKDPECYTRRIAWTDNDQKDLQTPPIFIAVDFGQVEVVKAFIDHVKKTKTKKKKKDDDTNPAADINIADSNDYSPLSWASWNGNEDMVKLLIVNGARVDQEALDLAKEYDHKDIIPLLMEKIDLYVGLNDDIDEIMIKASREGDVKKVQELIANGYDFNKWKEDDGSYQEYSPIYIAVKNGHVDIIGEFMQAGVEAELHSTQFHYPDDDNDDKPPPPKEELSDEQIAAIVKQMKEENEEEEKEKAKEESSS